MVLARALPLLLLLVAGCATAPEPITAPLESAARAAEVDWSQAELVEVTLTNFAFTPDRLVFERARPYRLHLENRGTGGHNFTAPTFFRSVALRQEPLAAEARASGGAIEVAAGEAKDLYLVPVEAGTFPLECTHLLHPMFGMTGEIVVR